MTTPTTPEFPPDLRARAVAASAALRAATRAGRRQLRAAERALRGLTLAPPSYDVWHHMLPSTHEVDGVACRVCLERRAGRLVFVCYAPGAFDMVARVTLARATPTMCVEGAARLVDVVARMVTATEAVADYPARIARVRLEDERDAERRRHQRAEDEAWRRGERERAAAKRATEASS